MTVYIIESADEESLVLAVEYVSNLLNDGATKTALVETPGSKFAEQCQASLQQQQFDQVASQLISNIESVFAKGSPSDAECVANVIVHTITKAAPEQQGQLVQAYASTLVSKVDERAEDRLGALLNLYGALAHAPSLQRHALLTAADYARKGPNLARILVPAVRGKSGEWIQQWKLNEAQTRELLIALANLVKAGADRASVNEYHRLIGCALEQCQAGDAAAIQQLQPVAQAACIEFIRSNVLFQADWCSSPAVKALANDPATKPLYTLFSAVLSGDLQSFKSAAVASALEAANTTQEAAISKARLVALLTLCSKSQEVSFSSLQAALDVPAESVESWVVRAIGAKLIDAKIDQVQELVKISRCTQRVFGTSEWSHLDKQLASWREAIKSVQQMITAQRTSGAASATGASSAAPAARPPAVRA